MVVLVALLAMPSYSWAKMSMGIVATVNKDAISETDVNNRLRLIFASSGIPDTAETRAKVTPQAIDMLIEEQLKIQEAKKNKLDVTEDEIKAAFGNMAEQNKMSPEDFAKVMQKSGIPMNTLLQQIKAQLAWNKVIGAVLRPRIEVSETDINAKMQRLKDNVGKTEYQVSEIFLPVTDVKDDKKIEDLGLKLIEEIKMGRAPFAVVAAQFSKSATAVQGGSLGWVQEGDLPKEQDVVIRSLSDGQISPPIKGLSGYNILTVTGKREISGETLPSDEEVLNSIGLQRLDRLQKRHLADIRSISFIERRD